MFIIEEMHPSASEEMGKKKKRTFFETSTHAQLFLHDGSGGGGAPWPVCCSARQRARHAHAKPIDPTQKMRHRKL